MFEYTLHSGDVINLVGWCVNSCVSMRLFTSHSFPPDCSGRCIRFATPAGLCPALTLLAT